MLPASLLGNWRAEAEKFAPGLKLRFLHRAVDGGRDLAGFAENPQKELAVTTYAMLARQDFLDRVDWNLIIADEAQAVKNPGARQTKALKALKAKARLALTGTPVENRLGDLWSLFDFLNPGLLGKTKEFNGYVGRLAKSGWEAAYAPLRRLIGPYILRRLKTDRRVIADLTDKVESLAFYPLTKKQAALYQKTVDGLAGALAQSDGIARRGLILQTIMRLKQVCNHPDQMSGGGAKPAKVVDGAVDMFKGQLHEKILSPQNKGTEWPSVGNSKPSLVCCCYDWRLVLFDLTGQPDHHLIAGVTDFAANGQTAVGASALAIEISQGAWFVDADFFGNFLTGGEDGKLAP